MQFSALAPVLLAGPELSRDSAAMLNQDAAFEAVRVGRARTERGAAA